MDTKAQLFARLKKWAPAIKRDVVAVYVAARVPRVPWYAKKGSLFAPSPLVLIPDWAISMISSSCPRYLADRESCPWVPQRDTANLCKHP